MQKQFTLNDILNLEQRFRVNFINSLAGYKLPVLIGTINTACKTNLAVFNSYFHVGANPPLFGLVVRPDSVERHTLSNIQTSKTFTVNFIDDTFFKQAHQTSARYASEQSEFTETGLKEEYREGITAPFVLQSKLKLAAECVNEIPVSENGTIILLNRIQTLFIEDTFIANDGYIDLPAQHIIACQGLDAYLKADLITRLAYAKPNQASSEI